MMDCNQVQSLLSAWLDQELGHDDQLTVEKHLSCCPICHTEAHELRLLHSELVRAFVDSRSTSRNVPERVITQLTTVTPSPRPPSRQSSRLLVAFSIALLLLSFLFSPESKSPAQSTELVATVMVSTGEVEVQKPSTSLWACSSIDSPLSFEKGTSVRTGPSSTCEVQTRKGNIIRLSTQTTVSYPAEDKVVIDSGQVLCRAPSTTSPLKVQMKHWTVTSPGGTFALVCGPNGCRIVGLEGKTYVESDQTQHQLGRGDSLQSQRGQKPEPEQVHDPVWETRWTHPLLMKKGKGNKELERRAGELLLRLGSQKGKQAYEQELRKLGDHAAPVLLTFVKSRVAAKMPFQRRKAMEILADVSLAWAIPELIPLLKDYDPEIRADAARGLRRLTGLTHGRAPSQWKSPDWTVCKPTFQTWKLWWTENEVEYKLLMPEAALMKKPRP